MISESLINRNFNREFKFHASRSSGPGGQNVNKVNSKVELRIDIINSQIFTDQEKLILSHKLKNHINNDGELLIISQTERTQLLNKQKCIEKFYFLIQSALTQRKKRFATKPSLGSINRRIETKKINSGKKNLRQKPLM
jgi:ribosome-associated protein